MSNQPSRSGSPRLPARKQLAQLAQFVVVVFLTALFFYLRTLDAQSHRRDFESVMALGSLTDLPIHRLMVRTNADDAGFSEVFDRTVFHPITEWLRMTQPQIDEAHRRARDKLVALLTKSGVGLQQIGRMSGKGGDESVPFVFFRTGVAPLRSRYKEGSGLETNPSIGMLLDETRHLGRPTTIQVVQEVKSIPDRLNLDIAGDDRRPGSVSLESVFLETADRLVLNFTENIGVGQRVPSRSRIEVPVATVSVPNVRMLNLLGSDLFAAPLTSIATDERRHSYLDQTYGGLRLDNARSMTGDRMLDRFQNVEMLGFSFSPKYFWLFMFALLSACDIAVAVHLGSGKADDETTAFATEKFLDRVGFRLLFWCLIPGTAMLLTHPGGVPPLWLLACYWIALAGIVVTGAALAWWSTRFRALADTTPAK